MKFFFLSLSLFTFISCGQQESIEKIAEEKRLSKQSYSINLDLESQKVEDYVDEKLGGEIPIWGSIARIFATGVTMINGDEVSGEENFEIPNDVDLDQAIISDIRIKKISLKIEGKNGSLDDIKKLKASIVPFKKILSAKNKKPINGIDAVNSKIKSSNSISDDLIEDSEVVNYEKGKKITFINFDRNTEFDKEEQIIEAIQKFNEQSSNEIQKLNDNESSNVAYLKKSGIDSSEKKLIVSEEEFLNSQNLQKRIYRDNKERIVELRIDSLNEDLSRIIKKYHKFNLEYSIDVDGVPEEMIIRPSIEFEITLDFPF